MPFIVSTLTQISGETDSDFETRVQTFINDQNYYYTQVGGEYPTTRTSGNQAYIGYPPVKPEMEEIVWDGSQMRRSVTFAYDNTYYFLYIGASPPFPPPPPFPTNGDLVMFGTGGTLADTGFNVDTGATTVDWNGYRHKNNANGIDPQDLATVAQVTAAVGVTSVNGDTGPAVILTVTDVGTGGTLAWSGVDLQIPEAASTKTGLLTSTDWSTFDAKQPAGSYITALTGDVTASGPGSAAATIANAAVTFAKIQDLSGPSILTGRYSAGTGSMQEITLGTGISMSGGGVLSATGTGGTVTSFSAGNLSPLFTTSVATATTTPVLTFAAVSQNANLIFAGPATAPAAPPTFRSLVAADLPNTAVTAGSYGSATQVGTFTADAAGRLTAAANVTITPAASSITGGAALTKVDDTNVTLTLGGTPSTALLTAASLTLGWTGTLAASRGGLSLDTSASTGFPEVSSGTWSIKTASQMRTDLGLVIGTNVEAWSANLDSWAAVTRASGFDTFVATPSSANLLSLLTTKTGTGLNVFDTTPLFKTEIDLNNPANTFKYQITPAAITADRILNLPLTTQTETVAVQPTVATSANSNPTGTTSTTKVMMGIGTAITPKVTGRLLIIIKGSISNSVLAAGASVVIRYGTGTAPTNGAALTGTSAGTSQNFVAAVAGNTGTFSTTGYATGLTVGTAYWIDAALSAVTAGTATITLVDIIAIEI